MKKRTARVQRSGGDLSFVREFLQGLVDTTSSSSDPQDVYTGCTWIRQDEGMLTLDSREYRHYQQVRAELTKTLAPEGDISPSTIDSALQDAIFASIDIQNRRDSDTNTRVNEAVQALREVFNNTPEPFECWLEVGGLESNTLPSSFGRVRFVSFTESEVQRLSEGSTSSALLSAQKERLLGRCFGIATSEARDIRAATTLASGEIQETVECLNFFSDMLDYNSSWLFLPGDQEATSTTRFAVGDDGRLNTEFRRVGPMGGYDITRLRSQENIRDLVSGIHQLLQKRETEIDELLLKALRWAGRATVAPLRNEAFMLYAIALECVVLPGSDSGELRHRLSQRVAKITQDTVVKRVDIQKLMRKLYDIRSKIVHTGLYTVDEDDLYLMRNVAKGVVVTLLSDTRLAGLTTAGDLNQWYEERMLEG